MRLKKLNIEEGMEYSGIITSWNIDATSTYFRVFVESNEFKGVTFVKSIRYAEYTPSLMGDFCEIFDIIDENGRVFLDDLIDVEVEFTLKLGKDSNFYIDNIYPVGDEEDDESKFIM